MGFLLGFLLGLWLMYGLTTCAEPQTDHKVDPPPAVAMEPGCAWVCQQSCEGDPTG